MASSKAQTEALKNEIDELNAKNAQLEKRVRELLVLNEDRKFLTAENVKLKAENDRLVAEMSEFKHKVDESQSTVKALKEEIDELRDGKMKDAIKQREGGASSAEDKEFQKKFGLPHGEFSITYYNCMNSAFHTGFLYLAPHYLIWEPTSSLLGDKPIIIPLPAVSALNKTKAFGFLPYKGSTLEVKTKGGDNVAFRAFLSRKEAARNICSQASKIGHEIIMLRDNLSDVKTGT